MILRFLEYDKEKNTLLAEGVIGEAPTRLRLLVSRRTVATELLETWEGSYVKADFNTAGRLKEFGEPSGDPSKISKLVFRGLERRTREAPRHIILSGQAEGGDEVFFALASRRLGKRLTPGTPVLSLLVDHKGEVCDCILATKAKGRCQQKCHSLIL